MTPGFDRLLYTDCKAGMGRGAGGGFQVQAQSAGVDAAQSKMAVGWLLYEAQNAWIVQRRAVEDFPLGFAHACEAGFGTAQSRYVGTEATGARQGNHLADCLLTRDLDLYGPVRPAQLWRSELWRPEPWSSKDCPRFTDPLPLGPLTVDAVAQWLRGGKERQRVLVRLLSALEDPAGRRIVITASQPDDALMWIAAATLLLPVRTALDVSFKVFGSNAQQAVQRIVAIPSELNPQVGPGRGGSAFVLDAVACASDDTPVTQRAEFWVRRLATWDDPYDVVDAVELAESFDPGTSRGGTDAMITAWAVTAPGEPPADPLALFRWLSGTTRELMREHGPAVVDRIIAASPSPDVLRWIDGAVGDGWVEADHPALRGLLLTAEIAEVRGGGRPPGEVLPAIATDRAARRDADSELSSAILLGSDAHVDKLLMLATRHGVVPRLPPLLERLSSFVAGWLNHPAANYSPGHWVLRPEILDLAYDELRARLKHKGVEAVSDALRRLWPNFADRDDDLSEPLICLVQVFALKGLPEDQRLARLAGLLRDAPEAADPITAMSAIQHALVEWGMLGPAEVRLVVTETAQRVPLAEEIVRLAVTDLKRTAGRPTWQTLGVLHALDRRGVAPTTDPFPAMLTSDEDIDHLIGIIRKNGYDPDSSNTRRYLMRLGRANAGVIWARMSVLLRTCLECDTPDLGVALIEVLPATATAWLLERWAHELGGDDGPRFAALGVSWHVDERVPEIPRWRIGQALSGFGAGLAPDLREQWILGVQSELSEDLATTFSALVGDESAKRRFFRRNRAKDG